jgi:hypothetical protein
VPVQQIVHGWFDPFPPPPTTLDLVLVVVFFALWTLASIGVYYYRRRLFAGNGALIGVATRFAPYAITIGFVGLFLIVCRVAEVPYISIRFLLYLTVLAAIAYVGFLIYYLRRRYPARLAAVRAEEVRRRYSSGDRKRRKRRGRG